MHLAFKGLIKAYILISCIISAVLVTPMIGIAIYGVAQEIEHHL